MNAKEEKQQSTSSTLCSQLKHQRNYFERGPLSQGEWIGYLSRARADPFKRHVRGQHEGNCKKNANLL